MVETTEPAPGGATSGLLSRLLLTTCVIALIGLNAAILAHEFSSGGNQTLRGQRETLRQDGPSGGEGIYEARCVWCHGEEGRGDGPSAETMWPPPRDLVAAEYRVRSTGFDELPTDEDLRRAIADGVPGTPMPPWRDILSSAEIEQVVDYIKGLSPRFGGASGTVIPIPSTEAVVDRGREVYVAARCHMCHGEEGRGDGELTQVLFYEWGLPHRARDLTRGWTFKGGHEPGEIYRRITGGISGTPMGPYRDLLSDQERWDLAHYVASLDEEPDESTADFVLSLAPSEEGIPSTLDDPAWQRATPIRLALGGQVITADVEDRWWTPTVGTAEIRGLLAEGEAGFLIEWNDPTGGPGAEVDAVQLQFAQDADSRPYLLAGETEAPVDILRWQSTAAAEEWVGYGEPRNETRSAEIVSAGEWRAGRWRVIVRRPIGEGLAITPGAFLPILLAVQDGENGERENRMALSTWFFVTSETSDPLRAWLTAISAFLAVVVLQLWIIARAKS